MSQTCPNCGSENRETNRFCSNCGTALKPAASSAPSAFGAQATPPSGETTGGFAPAPGSRPEEVAYRVQRWEGDEQPEAPQTPPEPPAFTPPAYGGAYAPSGSVPPPPPRYGAPTIPVGRPAGPPAEMRMEGGTYLPYAPEVVRTLEDKRSTRAWLIPSVIALAVVLVALGAVVGYLVVTGGKNTGAVGTSAGSGQQAQAGGSEEEIIKQVIRQSNEEQIKAWHELNTEILSGTRTGQVLQENIDAVEQLRSRDMYAVPVNHRLDFGKITINGDNATAETVEEWTVTFYQKSDDKLIDKDGPRVLSEVYYLVKVNGKWLISQLNIQDMPEQTPGANNA